MIIIIIIISSREALCTLLGSIEARVKAPSEKRVVPPCAGYTCLGLFLVVLFRDPSHGVCPLPRDALSMSRALLCEVAMLGRSLASDLIRTLSHLDHALSIGVCKRGSPPMTYPLFQAFKTSHENVYSHIVDSKTCDKFQPNHFQFPNRQFAVLPRPARCGPCCRFRRRDSTPRVWHALQREFVKPKRGGGSKPAAYSFHDLPSMFISKLQTTVSNEKATVDTREIENDDTP